MSLSFYERMGSSKIREFSLQFSVQYLLWQRDGDGDENGHAT